MNTSLKQLDSKHADWDYIEIANALTETCREGRAVNVYCDAMVSNKDRDDGKQMGVAMAVLYHEGREYGHAERNFGDSVTETDALIRSLTPGLDVLTTFLATKTPQYRSLIIFLIPSSPALNKMIDASTHEEQATSIRHLKILGELFLTYPNIEVRLQWLLRKVPFIGFRRAKQLAFETIRLADPADLRDPQSIKKQTDTVQRAAIAMWEERYYSGPRTTMAYKTALRNPPNGKAHHAFNTKPIPKGKQKGAEPEHTREQERKAKFLRLTHSTLLRFITGHAFIGEYTKRFYPPPHTQEQITCPCGEPLQTIKHVLIECTLYTATRRRHLTANGWPRTLPQLFANSKRIDEVLRFLEETGACTKPRARWEPG